jgi:uncharacterized protein YraI
MLRRKMTLILSVLLITVLSACNLPGEETTPTPDIALTVSAQVQLLETPTPLDTATPEFTPTPGFTSTPSVPTVTVSVNTNCRTGPSIQYDLVGGVNVGQSAVVVGKNTSTGYWIINNLNGSGTCWLWGQYATVSGNTAGLSEYPIPPTPTPSPTLTPTSTPTPPSAPSNLNAVKDCKVAPNTYGGTISWQDNSDNETGFRIYLGATAHGTVGPNVTTYPIPAVVTNDPTITLSVEAFNSGGSSAKISVDVHCP